MSRSPENQRPSSADSFDSDFQRALELSKQEHNRPPSANSVDEDLRRALELSLRQEQIRASASSSTDWEFQRALALSAQEQPGPSSPRARISEWQQAVPLQDDKGQPPRRQKTDTSVFRAPPPVPPQPSYSSPRNGPPSPQPKVLVPGPRLPGTWVFDNTKEEDIYGVAKPNLTPPPPPPRSYTSELPQGNGVGVTSPRTPPRQTSNTTSTSPVSSADLRSEPATGQTTPASIFGIPRRRMRHERSLTPEATISSPQTLPPFDLSENAVTSTLRPTSTFTLPPPPDFSPLEHTSAAYPAPPSVFTFASPPVDLIDDTHPPTYLPTTTFSLSSPTEDFDYIASASTVELAPSSVFSLRPVEDVDHDEHFSTSELRPTSVFSLASMA